MFWLKRKKEKETGKESFAYMSTFCQILYIFAVEN